MAVGYDDKSLAPARATPGLAFWTNGFGAWGNFDGNRNAATADRNLGGFVSGMDANIGGTWRLGVATGFSQSDISVDARRSAADVDSFHLPATRVAISDSLPWAVAAPGHGTTSTRAAP